MKNFGTRLRYLREKVLKEPRKKFISGLGITEMTLQRYEKDERRPDADFLYELWVKYRDRIKISDLVWLLTGQEFEYLSLVSTPVLGRIPAGFPEHVGKEEILKYISLPDTPKEAYALVVEGNSMAPEIKHGNYAIFIPRGLAEINQGDIIVATNEFGQSVIKRCVMKDGEISLKSDNPEYPSVKLSEGYNIVGKVLAVWSKKKMG